MSLFLTMSTRGGNKADNQGNRPVPASDVMHTPVYLCALWVKVPVCFRISDLRQFLTSARIFS